MYGDRICAILLFVQHSNFWTGKRYETRQISVAIHLSELGIALVCFPPSGSRCNCPDRGCDDTGQVSRSFLRDRKFILLCQTASEEGCSYLLSKVLGFPLCFYFTEAPSAPQPLRIPTSVKGKAQFCLSDRPLVTKWLQYLCGSLCLSPPSSCS